jgi:hypothetical protein
MIIVATQCFAPRFQEESRHGTIVQKFDNPGNEIAISVVI